MHTRTYGKIGAALIGAGALLALTFTATPSAAAVSVNVEGEKCTFEVTETDVVSSIRAELTLNRAIYDRVQNQYPELADQINYFHQQVQDNPRYLTQVPASGYLGRSYHDINNRGLETGFHDGELPRSIADAAVAPSMEHEIDSRVSGIPLDSVGEWNRSDTELFLNFQPKTESDLIGYWPARTPGASESLLTLQVSAAKDINYLDHLLSVNAAYQACASGISGEFPVQDSGPGFTAPALTTTPTLTTATTAVPVPAGSTKILAAPAQGLPVGETTEAMPAPAPENSWSTRSTSLITLVIAVLMGLMVVFLSKRGS